MSETFGGGTGPLHAHQVADGSTPATESYPPVTQPGRITGTTAASAHERGMADDDVVSPPRRRVDWAAIIASVTAGIGVTLFLIALGSSLGLSIGAAKGSQNGSAIAQSVGVWAVVAAVIGAFVGSFVGGRFARFLSRASAIYHGVASWGLTAMVTIVLAALGATGLIGAALNATATVASNNNQAQKAATSTATSGSATASQQQAANNLQNQGNKAADTGAKIGWAVTLGLLLTLVAACAGWFLGARWRLFGYERESDVELIA